MKTSMKKQRFLTMKAALAAVALAGMAGAASAQGSGSTVIDFEQLPASPFARSMPLIGNGDEFYQNGYWMAPFSNSGDPRSGDLVGVIVDGLRLAETCFGVSCPGNNSTGFLATLNDAVVAIGALDGRGFTVQGLDASFLGAAGEYIPSTSGILRILGVRDADGQTMFQDFPINGLDELGNLNFSHFATFGDFATTAFSQIYIYGGACDAAGNCTLFDNNRGQFALDNLSVTAVPEPSQWALMALGLGVTGFLARRRGAARQA